jgi:hypothetical protein
VIIDDLMFEPAFSGLSASGTRRVRRAVRWRAMSGRRGERPRSQASGRFRNTP